MPSYRSPGVYVEEISTGARPIEAVGTSTAGFVGKAPNPDAHLREAVAINNWSQFIKEFAASDGGGAEQKVESTPLSHAVYGFFQNGGSRCYVVNSPKLQGTGVRRDGLDLLEEVDEIAIVAAPGFSDFASHDALLSHCEKLKDRVAILDPPPDVQNIDRLKQTGTVAATPSKKSEAKTETKAEAKSEIDSDASEAQTGLRPRASSYGAFYFPYITVRDPFSNEAVDVPPSGHLAGIYARTDSTRGVHKAPANESIRGALNVTYRVTHEEQGDLNINGVNCIRYFPLEGIRVWGARTLDTGGEWRYLNVRRLFNMIEKSIGRSTRWIVFEPNDAGLWKSIRRDVSAFLTLLWRQGALMGATPDEAFFVQCDAETNPPEVIDAGQVVAMIGIAPVKPAEFVIFRLGQSAAGTEIESA